MIIKLYKICQYKLYTYMCINIICTYVRAYTYNVYLHMRVYILGCYREEVEISLIRLFGTLENSGKRKALD